MAGMVAQINHLTMALFTLITQNAVLKVENKRLRAELANLRPCGAVRWYTVEE